MSVTIGPYIVDTAEGILRPAAGIIKTSVDPAPPTYYTGQAIGVASTIDTAAKFNTPGAALAAALAYRTLVGAVVMFRGVPCFVADVEPNHAAAKAEGGEAIATARWTLVASLSWVPV